MRLRILPIVVAAAVVAPSVAAQEAAFLEGHVFNKLTGVPLSGALVRVFEVGCTWRPPPGPLLASGSSDDNGFYQFEITQFLGCGADIEVVCQTRSGDFDGGSSATLRAGLIRRDVYLSVPRSLTGCRSIP
jgi:hypothetical protein